MKLEKKFILKRKKEIIEILKKMSYHSVSNCLTLCENDDFEKAAFDYPLLMILASLGGRENNKEQV